MSLPDIEISFDDGAHDDIRVVTLLEKYQLKATFFIPSNSWGADNLHIYDGHEVACHTHTHPQDMKDLTEQQIRDQINYNVLKLKTSSKKFCPPRGRYDQRVIKVLKSYGFTQLRTTKVLCIKKSKELVQDTTIHMYHRKEYKGEDLLQIAKRYYELAKPNGYYHVWGHSHEIEKYSLWSELESIFQMITR